MLINEITSDLLLIKLARVNFKIMIEKDPRYKYVRNEIEKELSLRGYQTKKRN